MMGRERCITINKKHVLMIVNSRYESTTTIIRQAMFRGQFFPALRLHVTFEGETEAIKFALDLM